MSKTKEELKSEEVFAIIAVAALVSIVTFWPMGVVAAGAFVVFKSKKMSKKVKVATGIGVVYMAGITLGFLFPSLGSQELKDTYDKAPRIFYPFVVPVVIGANLDSYRITASGKEEKIKALRALQKQVKEEKNSLIPEHVDFSQENYIHNFEDLALGAETSKPVLLTNPENFSVINYHSYLAVKFLSWIFSSKAGDKETKEMRVNLVLASWGILDGRASYGDGFEFSRNYEIKDEARVEILRAAIREIVL